MFRRITDLRMRDLMSNDYYGDELKRQEINDEFKKHRFVYEQVESARYSVQSYSENSIDSLLSIGKRENEEIPESIVFVISRNYWE